MNKQFARLARQAAGDTQKMMIMEYSTFESELYKRFGELVVGSCIQIVKEEVESQNTVDGKGAANNILDAIENQFGVK